MTIRNRVKLMLMMFVIIAGICLPAMPQQALARPAQSPVQSLDPAQPMPVDPEITIGQFANGLRYYIKTNRLPEKRAELRLVVKAGSVLEDEDQQGLAHFLEHMAFNGTRNFPKQEVVSFIESLGMRFGAHLNAYTSFDETVYMLQVPTDKPETLERSFLILEDWAHGITMDPAEVDKERGVVMEEWRLRRGAGARMTDKMLPILLKGSRYADRLPIGKTEILQNFKYEQLKKFYTDWYRPDLMAVVAVGDFDKATIENLIKKHFGSIPSPAAPRPRPTYDIPDQPETVYGIVTDKEMTATSIEVDNVLPARKQGTIGVYRQQTVDRLFTGMLNARFSEIAQKPDSPFLAAGGGRGSFVARTKEVASLEARVKEDSIEQGLEAVLAEVERVARFGFTATELDRQKQNVLRSYERMQVEGRNIQSGARAAEYIRNFLEDESLPSIEDEYRLHQQFLPQVTLDEVNKIAREWYNDKNRLVIVTAPDKPGLVIPNETKLAAVLKAAPSKDLTAYKDNVSDAVLLDTIPTPGAITRTTTRDSLQITEWELSNGVKVVLKPTTFREDEIIFRATSPGGTSLASDADYIPASTATQLVTAGGLGKFSAIDLRKVLTGKVASAGPFIGELEEGISGSASRKDLETMFQLIYLRFTQPRADANSFTVQATQARTVLANQTAVPEFAFAETLTSTLSRDHLRRRMTTAATVDSWNLDKSLAFYKDRFADASDFTFVFVGSFDLATLRPLVERYLGSLPSTRRKETWKDVGVRPPTGVIEKSVEKGIEPKSQTAIVFSGPTQFEPMQRIAIRAMASVLSTRLLETIREELGGTYSISANQSYQKIPTGQYSVTIQFGSDPQRTNDLVRRVFQEIEQFKTKGPSEKQLTDQKEALMREFETNIRQNNYLLGQLASRYQVGEDPADVWTLPEYYKKLDAAMIQEAAKTYLNMNNYVRVTLLPEKK
jgi:zinc protease